jgi:hypothetical protein
MVPAPMTWINSRLERFIFAITDICKTKKPGPAGFGRVH